MINLMLGRPGSGKSYEAVVYHIVPALQQGRKIITNLPLNLEFIGAIEPHYLDLIEIREYSLTDKTKPAFSALKDYDTTDWRNERNQGPLLVIDECHKGLPRSGTPRPVEEWYAEHRHLGVDVLLITQSHSKISKAIIEMVQVVYRLSNNRSLGHDRSYIRKTLDGVKGAELSTQVRSYEPAKFKFYKSHTKTEGSVKEARANDITPIYKHWSFYGAGLFFVAFLVILASMDINVLGGKAKPVPTEETDAKPKASSPSSKQTSQQDQPQVVTVEQMQSTIENHPYSAFGVHIDGFMEGEINGAHKMMYTFLLSQNGQYSFRVPSTEFQMAGYKVTPLAPCLALLTFNAQSFYAACDIPRVNGASVPAVAAMTQPETVTASPERTLVVMHSGLSDFDGVRKTGAASTP